MAASAGSEKPNLLLLVLDCVRAWDFLGGTSAVGPMPFTERLLRDSVYFPNAASVAHWTVPSHASMFTGLYPWEHGVHAKGLLKLADSAEGLGPLLRGAGYTTLSISANGLISPDLGLVHGMDRSAWGVSLFNRIGVADEPPQGSETEAHRLATAENTLRKRLASISYWTAYGLARAPAMWDFATRLAMRVRHPSFGARPRLAHWVEPTAARWIREAPRGQPVYCFVNLLDAHEPYLAEPDVVRTLRAWWAYARTRQDRLGWVSGDWKPTEPELVLLHELYRTMVRSLDQRIESIVRAFQDSGRWENTTMILTGDHGQAFGEHDAMFHIVGVDEPELRVPLYVRYADRHDAGKVAQSWASLIDVYPTLLREAGIVPPERPSRPIPLQDLVENPRTEPVFAMSDGLVHDADRQRTATVRREAIDRLLVAGYDGEFKVIHDPVRGDLRAFHAHDDPAEAHDLWSSKGPELAPLAEGVREIGRRILAGPASEVPTDVEDRLRSWGYI
jgi:arylsulfatase A-like enzyme